MCNYLHESYKPIPIKGHGYKLFTKFKNSNDLRSLIRATEYQKDNNNWIHWDKEKYIFGIKENDTYGFCFFRNKELAEHVYKTGFFMDDVILRKIEFDNGLGEVQESNMIKGTITIALCKSFRIIEE